MTNKKYVPLSLQDILKEILENVDKPDPKKYVNEYVYKADRNAFLLAALEKRYQELFEYTKAMMEEMQD